jgi:TPR repeat protein
MKFGYASSMLKIGTCYEKGKGVTKDESKAFKYYRKSMKNGYNEAIACFARCYETEIGVK